MQDLEEAIKLGAPPPQARDGTFRATPGFQDLMRRVSEGVLRSEAVYRPMPMVVDPLGAKDSPV
jgi:hypothetical protein